MEVDFNLLTQRVARTRERIAAVCGDALKPRIDIGPGLISVTLADWVKQH
jgi:putative transposase